LGGSNDFGAGRELRDGSLTIEEEETGKRRASTEIRSSY